MQKESIYVLLGYYKGMKVYRLLCLKKRIKKIKIHKNKDIVFMEDNISIRNGLEIHQNEKNEGLRVVVVVVDQSSKSPLFDGSGQCMDDNEQVGDNGVAIEEAHEGSANEDIIVEFGGER